jgi:hypothetical protein
MAQGPARANEAWRTLCAGRANLTGVPKFNNTFQAMQNADLWTGRMFARWASVRLDAWSVQPLHVHQCFCGCQHAKPMPALAWWIGM